MTKRAPRRGQYDRELSPEQRHSETRDRILRATVEAVGLQGFANASVEHIVKAAGISRRTFYEHFADLKQALVSVHQETANLLFHAVQDATRRAEGPADRMRAGIEAFFATIIAKADFARVALQQFRGTPEHDAIREVAHARYIAFFLEELAKAHAAGIASRAPDELTVYALVNAMEAIAARYLVRREEQRLMEAIPPMMELLVRAFL